MYCEVCGTPIPKGSQFCPNCGRPVRKEAPQKPMLLRWGLPALIVVMIAAVLCGLLFRSRMNEHGTQEAQVSQPLSVWSQELPEAYETLLSDYANAIEHGWSQDRLAEADLSYMASYYYDPANLGYLCTDLDRNSVPELFLGDMVSQENGTPFFFELYTLTDGTLTRLFSGGERDTLSLCLDGTVMEKGADGAYSSCVYYYTLETGGTLHLKESLQLLSDSGDVSSWIHRIGEGDEGEIISDQEALAVQSSYYRTMTEVAAIVLNHDTVICRDKAYWNGSEYLVVDENYFPVDGDIPYTVEEYLPDMYCFPDLRFDQEQGPQDDCIFRTWNQEENRYDYVEEPSISVVMQGIRENFTATSSSSSPMPLLTATPTTRCMTTCAFFSPPRHSPAAATTVSPPV